MTRKYSLAQLTTLTVPPPELVTLGAKVGYDFVGIRILPAAPGGLFHDAINNPAMRRETARRIADTGVGVFDLEIIRIDAAFDAAQYEAFCATGAELGAKAVLVAGDDADEARLIANFAAFCDLARPFGLSADLEFMPWTAVKCAGDALRVVTAANRENAGILVDALHFGRSATTLDDIRALPRRYLNYCQICDAPGGVPTRLEDFIYAARTQRLLPGDGGIDVAGLFAALPADAPVSIEIPMGPREPALDDEAWARLCLERSKALLAGVDKA